MTVLVSKPALNLREELSALKRSPPASYQQFRFTGDASTVAFSLPLGWTPFAVYSTSGAILLEGAADDYTYVDNTITFAVAPSAADFTVIGELKL